MAARKRKSRFENGCGGECYEDNRDYISRVTLPGEADHGNADDFRHTVATRLYDGGASIEVIRDYLGHRESDMTKQYLDYMPKRIDAANETYFQSMPAALTAGTEG